MQRYAFIPFESIVSAKYVLEYVRGAFRSDDTEVVCIDPEILRYQCFSFPLTALRRMGKEEGRRHDTKTEMV